MRYLLINPWIYDFAAYDFGLKPVGLLRIAQYLRQQGHQIYLIDCLAGCAKKSDEYGFSKIKKQKIEKPPALRQIDRPYARYGISPAEFKQKLQEIKNIDEIYVTSGMTYWYPGVQLAIKLLRDHFKNVPIILGGIYATLCYEHAAATSGADKVWRGNYLSDDYFTKPGFYPAYDLVDDKSILPVQLTRGCPFRCTYCASKILAPEFEMKNPDNFLTEIIHYYKNFGATKFLFYDDALTYRSQDGLKKFLKKLLDSGIKFTFYTPNGLHVRFIDEELAGLLKQADFQDLRLSLETSDEVLQKSTGGKVTNRDLEKAIKNLKKAGFGKNDLGVYLLAGTPWVSLEQTKKDMEFIHSLGVQAVLASYSPIPGTADYRKLVETGVIPEDLDPLWHNKTIFAELFLPEAVTHVRKLRRLAAQLNKL